MSRMIGTVSRGVRAPIIRSGDDLCEIVTNSVLEAAKSEVAESTLDLLVVFPEGFWNNMLTYTPSPDNAAPNVDIYYNTEYEDYEIPPEALEDEQFDFEQILNDHVGDVCAIKFTRDIE